MTAAPSPRSPVPFESAGPGYRPLTTVALLALRADGRVALVRRAKDRRHHAQGELDLVGGRLEPSEWLEEAACRQAAQMLGIQVGTHDVELSGIVHHRDEAGAGRVCIVFSTQRWAGAPYNAAACRYSEVVWADPGGPPADCRPLTHTVLNSYVAGTLYTAFALPAGGTEEDRRVRPPRAEPGPQLEDRGHGSGAVREAITSKRTETWGMK
ncbi:NUDIX domain-containing protein [Streptomyces sp. H27-H1]|uniref:NUDIX domain-containing protein n=1 Tax=Streptomyces sp. H27-H1 TaxID=2996461 RepID=UPI002270DB86|nr:NUDIX domain-containing protein [Streptomyces sp. H27-H1]MCY0932098.1 NUDIX domain-containing protein [Streptomyces sp. H27-H1]